MKFSSVNRSVLTPLDFLTRSALVYPERTAVVHGDNRYTYKELQGRIFRLANALKKQGIQKGDKVAFLSPNIPPMLEAHYAVPMIGAALVTVNIRLSPGEVSYIVNHCDAKMVFVDNEFSGLIKPGELDKVKAYVNICDRDDTAPLDGVTYEEFLAQSDPTPMSPDVDDEDQVISINYTSGTTGRPKGVMYHHRGAYLNAVGEVLEAGLDISSVYLWTLPMFHCNGWCFTWGVTAVGGTHICLRNVVAEEIYRLIEKENVSHLCAAPTVLITMSGHPGARDVKMKRKLQIMTAGAPPAPTIIQNMEDIGADITHTYGLTEVFGARAVDAAERIDQRPVPTFKGRRGAYPCACRREPLEVDHPLLQGLDLLHLCLDRAHLLPSPLQLQTHLLHRCLR